MEEKVGFDQTLYSGKEYQADEFEANILRRAEDLAYLDQERLMLILGRKAT